MTVTEAIAVAVAMAMGVGVAMAMAESMIITKSATKADPWLWL